MKILLINHYAGSREYGMEYRPYYLAREWVKQGHQVTIVGASFSHLRMKNPHVKKDYQEETIEGIKYLWFKVPEYKGSLKRIINILTFVSKLNMYSKRLCDDVNPDLVIASSTYTLDNYVAHKIAKLSCAKYIYEIHDLWPLSPMLIGGYSKYHPFIMVLQRAEDYAYKHVDKVVSLLWNAEEHCKEHGLKDGKFICIPNGFAKDEWTGTGDNSDLPKLHKKVFDQLNDKIVLGYSGGFAMAASLETLIDAAKNLRENPLLQVVLVGQGPELSKLTSLVEEYNLTNVTILPPVSKKNVPQIVKHFDMAYIGGIHSELHKYGTAVNKRTDYMLSSKPIIFAIDEPGSLVEQINCGIQVEAENDKKVADAISKLLEMSETEREMMGKRGRDYALANLEWSLLAKKFIDNI